MPSIAEAIYKLGRGNAAERLEAACVLADHFRSSKSEAALKALTLCLQDKKRCTADIGRVAVKALPPDVLADIAYKHHDDDVKTEAIRHALASYVPIDPTKLTNPKHVAIVAADGLRTSKEPHPHIVSLVGGHGKKIAPFLKSEISSGQGEPSGASIKMMVDLLSKFHDDGDDSHAEKMMSMCSWDARAANMLSSLAENAGDSLLETAGEHLAQKCDQSTLMGILSRLADDKAQKFGMGMKRHRSFSGDGEIDYAIAKKSGDKKALMRALRNCPRMRSEAIEMLREGDRAEAIKVLLPSIYDSVDDHLLSELLSGKETSTAVIESVGTRLPSNALARIAKGEDRQAAAAAIRALKEKGRSALAQLRQEDAEI